MLTAERATRSAEWHARAPLPPVGMGESRRAGLLRILRAAASTGNPVRWSWFTTAELAGVVRTVPNAALRKRAARALARRGGGR